MSVPTAFNIPFGHSLIVLNEASMDDAHVTVILAHGIGCANSLVELITNYDIEKPLKL